MTSFLQFFCPHILIHMQYLYNSIMFSGLNTFVFLSITDGFMGDIVVPNINYDLELKNQRLNEPKHPPGWDENFDQIEPKINPYEEDNRETEDWRARLHQERNRRIKHTEQKAERTNRTKKKRRRRRKKRRQKL